MIRRDYIIRMIEEFIQALTRIRSLKRDQRWDEASREVEDQFKRLLGQGARPISEQTETELLANIIRGEPTLAVRDKTLIVATLLLEAGENATAQNKPDESRSCCLKGLHLLLDVLGRGEVFEFPEFLPRVERFVQALKDAPVPSGTQGLLMQHYERTGEFAKAEDIFFTMLDAD